MARRRQIAVRVTDSERARVIAAMRASGAADLSHYCRRRLLSRAPLPDEEVENDAEVSPHRSAPVSLRLTVAQATLLKDRARRGRFGSIAAYIRAKLFAPDSTVEDIRITRVLRAVEAILGLSHLDQRIEKILLVLREEIEGGGPS